MYVVVHHTDTDFNDWKSFASYLKFVVETFLRNYSILCQIQTLYVFAYNPVLTKLLGAIWCIGQTFPRVFACNCWFSVRVNWNNVNIKSFNRSSRDPSELLILNLWKDQLPLQHLNVPQWMQNQFLSSD